MDTGEMTENYHVGAEIGHGQFGTIHIVMDKETGEEYACKTMLKRKLKQCSSAVDVEREIQVCCLNGACTVFIICQKGYLAVSKTM